MQISIGLNFTKIKSMAQLDFMPENAFVYDLKADQVGTICDRNTLVLDSTGQKLDQDWLDNRPLFYFHSQDLTLNNVSVH